MSQRREGYANIRCKTNAGDKNSYVIVRTNKNNGDQGLKTEAIDKNQLLGEVKASIGL